MMGGRQQRTANIVRAGLSTRWESITRRRPPLERRWLGNGSSRFEWIQRMPASSVPDTHSPKIQTTLDDWLIHLLSASLSWVGDHLATGWALPWFVESEAKVTLYSAVFWSGFYRLALHTNDPRSSRTYASRPTLAPRAGTKQGVISTETSGFLLGVSPRASHLGNP